MEAAIQSTQMDLDKEEVRPEQYLPSLPQERNICRVPELPPIPQGLPTNFDVNSEPELIEGDILWAELLPHSSHRNMGHEPLLTHQELSGSGEYHRALRRVEPIVFQRQGKKDEELVEEPKSFIHRPEQVIGNDSSFERMPSGIYQLQTSSRNIQREAQRTSAEEERSHEP
ncbi:hypothetical protein O181_011009 [Austropuccinia psidii MF-1]|uniref:Uncharacterized protein n=1 Tax=Austropuccinia psidii MF-1 TaxID=1389203 RepID=A0A9Q3GLF8_9BASI|nr:hypothetical protein [Austropuccinia psidii MF-1]